MSQVGFSRSIGEMEFRGQDIYWGSTDVKGKGEEIR